MARDHTNPTMPAGDVIGLSDHPDVASPATDANAAASAEADNASAVPESVASPVAGEMLAVRRHRRSQYVTLDFSTDFSRVIEHFSSHMRMNAYYWSVVDITENGRPGPACRWRAELRPGGGPPPPRTARMTSPPSTSDKPRLITSDVIAALPRMSRPRDAQWIRPPQRRTTRRSAPTSLATVVLPNPPAPRTAVVIPTTDRPRPYAASTT
jgi:hypothetical protein